MENLAEVLETELEDAFELKNKKALHNYITILINNIFKREDIDQHLRVLGNDIKVISETIKIGFEKVDKRFEDMYKLMDKRFEDMYKHIDKRFEDMYKHIDKRFEDVNKRFEDVNKRFEDMNKRFEDTSKKINILIWVISLWMTLFTSLSVFIKLYQ